MTLSTSEKAIVESAFRATLAFGTAEVQLGHAVGAESGDRSRLAGAAAALVRAAEDVRLIVCLLVGAEPEGERSKADLLALAWEHLDRTVGDTLPSALILYAALQPAYPQHLTYGLDLLRECLSRLTAVREAGRDSLLHADPTDEKATGPVRTLIGPHGDFVAFQTKILATVHYLNEWASYWPAAYRARTDLPAEFGEVWRLYAAGCNTLHQASALACGISLYWRWDGYDQFHRVEEVANLLWRAAEGESVATFFHALMVAWCKIITPDPLLQRQLRVFTDSWRNMDRAGLEGLFVFPNRPDLAVVP